MAHRHRSACISGILRIYYTIINQQSRDVSWNYKGIAWASSLETGSGIVIASLPVLPRLVKWVREKRKTGTTGSSWFSKSSRSYSSLNGKPQRLRSESTEPSSRVHGPAALKRNPSDFNGDWIPLQDEQLKAVRVEARAAVPISEDRLIPPVQDVGRGVGELSAVAGSTGRSLD